MAVRSDWCRRPDVNPHLITATHDNPRMSKVRLLLHAQTAPPGTHVVTGGAVLVLKPHVTYCNPDVISLKYWSQSH